MPLLLLISLREGYEVQGIIAAGAAFSVGFGVSHGLRGIRWGAMVAAALGIPVMAFIGSLVGEWPWALLAVAGLAAALCGALGMIDDDLWWVTLQWVIALLVAGSFAGPLPMALERAAFALSGGLAQVTVVIALATLLPILAEPPSPPAAKPTPTRLALLGQAARAAVAVMLAGWVARELHLSNSYWAPMTAMLVIKPGLPDTRTRGVARFVGTLAGCVLATLFVLAIRGSTGLQLLGLALTASAAFGLQKAHYAGMTAAITATIVLLISLASGSVLENSEHRLSATVVGGLIALLMAAMPLRVWSRVR